MTNIKQIKVGSTTYDIEDATARNSAAAKLSDFKINGVTAVTDTVANLTITDGVASTSTTAALSANQGKVLNDRIDALEGVGRYLALWDCTTGKPVTDPATLPYAYKSGDYYRVSKVGASNNKIPSGTSYTGAASSTVASDTVEVGDQYFFDGTVWSHVQNHNPDALTDVTVNGTSVKSGSVGVIPAASATATGALTSADWSTFNAKQDALTFDNTPTEDSANPVKSGGVYTALAGKVDKVEGSALVPTSKVSAYDTHIADTTIHVTSAQKTEWSGKQDAITASAKLSADLVEETATNKFNVQADWNASTGLAVILNKPSTFAPSAHAASHGVSGDDAITIAQSQVTGLSDALAGKQAQIAAGTAGQVVTYSGTAGTIGALAVDTAVGTGTNLVQNGAVKTAIDAITPHVNASGVLYFGTE